MWLKAKAFLLTPARVREPEPAVATRCVSTRSVIPHATASSAFMK